MVIMNALLGLAGTVAAVIRRLVVGETLSISITIIYNHAHKSIPIAVISSG
jgi:hypothetical protein